LAPGATIRVTGSGHASFGAAAVMLYSPGARPLIEYAVGPGHCGAGAYGAADGYDRVGHDGSEGSIAVP
jgi:hypothetical protein